MTLAWTPFIDPVPGAWLHHWYLYLIPVSFLIAVTYKAIRMRDLKGYPAAVAIMTIQIVLGMIALALASYVLVEGFVAWFAAHG